MRKLSSVKKLILSNAFLVIGIGFVCVIMIFLMTYFGARRTQEKGLNEATQRVSESVETFVNRVDGIGKALFLSDLFQDMLDKYNADPYDVETNRLIYNMFASYADISDAIIAISFVPIVENQYQYDFTIDFGEYHKLREDNDFFIDSVRQDGTTKQVIIDNEGDFSELVYFSRSSLDLRQDSPTFFQNKGFGLICVNKENFLKEVSLSIYQESFSFEVLYKDKVLATEFQREPDSKYIYSEEMIGDDLAVVGYVGIDNLGAAFINNLILICIFGVSVLIIAVGLSLLLNFYGTKSYRYLIANFNDLRDNDNSLEIKPTDDPNINKVIKSYNAMVQNRRELARNYLEAEYRTLTVEREKNRLEVDALYAQINKHFLFNVFTMIRAMVRDDEKQKALNCINAISIFLRYSLSPDQEVTIRQEMKALKSYIEIQALRYENIKFSIEYDTSLDDYSMPKMILQPIVENSFSHGNLGDNGYIRIVVKKRKSGLVFFISDNGKGISDDECKNINRNLRKHIVNEKSEFNGLALGNIQHRLELAVSEKSSISIKSVQGKGTVVAVRLIEAEND